jgi:predicted lipid-binding transport protein (Tim44 family)
VALSAIFGGLLFGRLVSGFMNGGFSGYSGTIRSLYVIDALGFVLALTALAYDNPRAH